MKDPVNHFKTIVGENFWNFLFSQKESFGVYLSLPDHLTILLYIIPQLALMIQHYPLLFNPCSHGIKLKRTEKLYSPNTNQDKATADVAGSFPDYWVFAVIRKICFIFCADQRTISCLSNIQPFVKLSFWQMVSRMKTFING